VGVNRLPKTVTRQRRDCDLHPGPAAPESSTLTTRLPSHPRLLYFISVGVWLLCSATRRVAASVVRLQDCPPTQDDTHPTTDHCRACLNPKNHSRCRQHTFCRCLLHARTHTHTPRTHTHTPHTRTRLTAPFPGLPG